MSERRKIVNIPSELGLLVAALGRSVPPNGLPHPSSERSFLRTELAGRLYYEDKSFGIAVMVEDGLVESVFLFAEGREEFSGYPLALPSGLAFGMDRDEVRGLVGVPTTSRPPNLPNPPEATGGWDAFVEQDLKLHVTYHAVSKRLDLVTLEPAGPRLD